MIWILPQVEALGLPGVAHARVYVSAREAIAPARNRECRPTFAIVASVAEQVITGFLGVKWVGGVFEAAARGADVLGEERNARS